ncbi:MAG: DUF1844 domain-containing protein [Planctomycetes bacterium]|nr:DUF1844 domain-containing protein [Planctomycetota bacterium]
MTEKHVDEEWKRQAQAEKERLARQEAQGRPGPPPADFTALVSTLAAQSMMALGLGQPPGPDGKPPPPDLDRAQFTIDLLDMLSEKTRGNLTPEEERHLTAVLHELHLAFVEMSGRSK